MVFLQPDGLNAPADRQTLDETPTDLSCFKTNVRLVAPSLFGFFSGAGVNKEFASIYGVRRLDRSGPGHLYRDSTDDPDRDSDHPGRDKKSTRSALRSKTIPS